MMIALFVAVWALAIAIFGRKAIDRALATAIIGRQALDRLVSSSNASKSERLG